MVCILGFLPENETKDYQLTNFAENNNFTNHVKLRNHRLDLINTLNVLYYFEVYRFIDKSRQIHCLLEDSSIVVFSKVSKKVITVILADPDLLNKYINKFDLERRDELILNRCAGLNKKYKANEAKLSDIEAEDYLARKNKILALK